MKKNTHDDTRKSGFVSAIVMKFTQNEYTSTNDLSNSEVKIKKMKQSSISEGKQPTKDCNVNSKDISGTNLVDARAEVKVFGDVSVKDRIKIFSELGRMANSVKILHGDHTRQSRSKESIERTSEVEAIKSQLKLNRESTHSSSISVNSIPPKSLSSNSRINELKTVRRVKVSELVDKYNKQDSFDQTPTTWAHKPIEISPKVEKVVNQELLAEKSKLDVIEETAAEKQDNKILETEKTSPILSEDEKSNIQKNIEVSSSDSDDCMEYSYSVNTTAAEPEEVKPDSVLVYNISNIRELSTPTFTQPEIIEDLIKDDDDDDGSDSETSISVSSVRSFMATYDKDVLNIYDPSTDENYYPLPKSYLVNIDDSGAFSITLPAVKTKSVLKNGQYKKKNTGVKFMENNVTMTMETYSNIEYERGDETIDPLTASAEYEIEKKTESLEKFEVTINKDEKGLGLSIVGIGLGSDMGSEKLGIYIKALTPGGASEKTNQLRIHDQLLEVDGVSLVGVTQAFAAQTLKSTTSLVRFLIGREVDVNETPAIE